jgi:hypothetical protein
LGSQGAGSFEAEDTRRDRKACVETTRGAVAGHPSDGAMKTNSQSALGGLVIKTFGGHHITHEVKGWQPSLGTLVHLLSYFPFLFS